MLSEHCSPFSDSMSTVQCGLQWLRFPIYSAKITILIYKLYAYHTLLLPALFVLSFCSLSVLLLFVFCSLSVLSLFFSLFPSVIFERDL